MGHHGGRCRPIRSQPVDRLCCVVVSMFLLGKLASKHAPPQPWRPASKPSSWHPPCQIGCFFASTNLGHHGGMIRDGSVGAGCGIGAGGEVFCSIKFLAWIDHGGRCHHTTAHSQFLSLQQLANIPCDRLVLIKLEKTIIINVY